MLCHTDIFKYFCQSTNVILPLLPLFYKQLIFPPFIKPVTSFPYFKPFLFLWAKDKITFLASLKYYKVQDRDLILSSSVCTLLPPGHQRFRHRRAGVGEDQGLLLVARHRGDVARHRKAAGQPRHEVAAVVRRRKVL